MCFSWHDLNHPPAELKFKIIDTKLYVPAVSLSKENDIKLLEQLKSGFKRTIKWNKYRSQMTIQPQNSNLDYLIDPTFTNVNRLFVLYFSRNNEGDNRDCWFWHIIYLLFVISSNNQIMYKLLFILFIVYHYVLICMLVLFL